MTDLVLFLSVILIKTGVAMSGVAKAQYNVKNSGFYSFFTFLGKKPQFFSLKQKRVDFIKPSGAGGVVVGL